MQGSICEVVSFFLGGRGGRSQQKALSYMFGEQLRLNFPCIYIYMYISCVYLYTNIINMIIYIYVYILYYIYSTSLTKTYKYYVHNSICWSLSSIFFWTYKVGPMTPLVLSVRMDCIEGHRLSDGKYCRISRCEPGRNER